MTQIGMKQENFSFTLGELLLLRNALREDIQSHYSLKDFGYDEEIPSLGKLLDKMDRYIKNYGKK